MIWIRYYNITEYEMVFDRCCSLSKLQGPKDQDVQETFKIQQKCCSEKQELYFLFLKKTQFCISSYILKHFFYYTIKIQSDSVEYFMITQVFSI